MSLIIAIRDSHNPVGVADRLSPVSQGSRVRQPWAVRRNPFGIARVSHGSYIHLARGSNRSLSTGVLILISMNFLTNPNGGRDQVIINGSFTPSTFR
jgi:hypothetical protein